jgi:peroxin-11B
MQREAYRAWFAGILCNAVAGFYTLYRLRQREQILDKKDGEGVVESKKISR